MARKKASLGCLFWTALVLLVIVVFLFNRTAIEGVLERTDLIGVLQRTFSGGDAAEGPVDPASDAPAAASEEDESAGAPASSENGVSAQPGTGANGGAGGNQNTIQIGPDEDAEAPAEPADPVDAPAAPASDAPAGEAVVPADQPATESGSDDRRERRARLYFVTVDDAGAIALHGLLRTIAYENAPLTATLTELLSGPASAELHQGYISLIPPGVQLRRVAVQDSVAIIDFSEQFRFNRLGQEGLSVQLQQIVYSATEFPTVSAVQILIDGDKVDYLGPEGLYVGAPIGRASF